MGFLIRSSEMKIRKGSRSKIPFLLTPILLLVLAFGVNSQALAGLNLEVPIDMVDHGLEVPSGTGTTNFNRAQIFVDANDYDGATYYFEIVAKNTDSSAKPVYFRRTTSTATNHATITVPAGTANYTRYRVPLSINPLTGKNQYLVRLTKTTSAAQLIVSSARLIVQQTNATKTRIQIPLVEKNHDIYQVGSGRADTTTSSVYTQGDADKYSLWKKDSSQYADISGWTLEAVLDNLSASATTYAALHRVSDGAIVADSEVSLLGTTIALVDTSFTNTATNFTDGSKFELKIRSSISGQRADLGRASLYVSLTNLSKAEVLYRVSRKVPTGPVDVVAQRVLIDTTLFTSPEVYFEATGRCADNTPLVFLRDHDANTSGTGGTDVSGSGINFNNANRDIVRTGEITPDSGDNFYVRVATNTNTLKVMHAWVVVVAPSASCATPGTPSSPSPANGVTGQSIDVDLDWSDCSDTDFYDVYFGTSASPPLYASDVAISSYTLPTLEYCTKYYWKIKAKNAGGCSTVGPIWDFTTENGPPGTPGSPDPFDGETGVSKNAVLDWSDCTGTDTYEVYLDKGINPPTTMVVETADSTYDPDLDWGSTYYWKIVAKNSCGSSTAGDVWTFTTEAAPPADHFVWDASPSQGAPYDSWDNAAHSIQTAINYASAGETVMVRAGTSYTEHVWMHNGKNLVAEEGARPSITYSPGNFVAVVEFTGPMTCNLKGFDIHAYTNMGEGVTLDGTGGQVNATIEDCIVHCNNLGVGIRMLGTVNTTIKDCVVYNSNVSMRAGIGTSGWGSSDRIASGSSITIKGTTVGGSGQGVTKAGIRLRGATGASNIRATIGGSGINDGNTISYNGSVGIILVDIDEVSIENNEISNNGDGGIVLVDSSTVSPHIKNNTIHHQTGAAGINIGGASTVTIGDNNNIYANYTGIAFYIANNGASFGDMDPITKTKSSQPVTITGNNIYSNSYAGIAVRDGITGTVNIEDNDIYSNIRGGMRIQRKCNLNILRNTIRDNNRGGIHTGIDTADGGGFGSTLGTAVLTIEKNKIHENGQGTMGAGIDVRHASGTIYNNLIYRNHRAGIRFGDYITEIINNTVVSNGTADAGGGVVYDDLAGEVDDPPAGVPPAPLLIRNNISAYNVKSGIRACFTNTVDSEERDYNLVYSNNGTGETDCGWPDSINMRCANKNFGGCGGKWNLPGPPKILPDGPNNNIADPLFVNTTPGNEDYHLQAGSPAENAGDDNLDMGAYGGSDPLDW
jgi:parallel beta-helix repeat protein